MNTLKTTFTPEEFNNALDDWLARAQVIINEHFLKMKFKHNSPTLYVSPNGRKYIRIVSKDTYGSESVYCFIEKETGNVLMAATWYAPAKHARGTIFIIGKEGVGPHGANYLK